ncbi:photosystem I reaction center subunit VIII [Tolypothrix sp. FACHB-123]|nr:photosystem I reaction center subunit VIII [Tolypothrix sp. FACHB-123]MBD2353798.1 photosystem I reaction center subunit VIII [Tolypothrix sp. FACHB-123]
MASQLLPSILASTSYLPALFVPIIGWGVPIAVFAFLFLYIEREDIA